MCLRTRYRPSKEHQRRGAGDFALYFDVIAGYYENTEKFACRLKVNLAKRIVGNQICAHAFLFFL